MDETEVEGNEQDNQKFAGDLRVALAETQSDVFDESLSMAKEIVSARSETDRESLRKKLAEATGCSDDTSASVLAIVDYLARIVIGDQDDTSADGLLDFFVKKASAGGMEFTEVEKNRLAHAVQEILVQRKSLEQASRISAAARGWLPMFEDLDATIELRSNRIPLISGDDQSEMTLELIPIASIRLTLDSGTPGEICFQAREADLSSLAEKFEKIRSELARLRQSVEIRGGK